jgi:hypothetical protein
MEKEGFGEEFSICSSFCLWGIRAGANEKFKNIFDIFIVFATIILVERYIPYILTYTI